MSLGFLQSIGPMEYLIIGVVMLLLFGRRLPEVGRSLGKGLVEFKKGLRDVDDEVKQTTDPLTQPIHSTGASQISAAAAKPPLGPSGEERRVHTSEEITPETESQG